jgi:hypothetical protein
MTILLILGSVLVGGFIAVFLFRKATSLRSEVERKHGYQPLTFYNASFFIVYDEVLLLLVTLASLASIDNFPPRGLPNLRSDNQLVAIVLFLAPKIYVFNNFRIKTNTLIAIISVLALDAFSIVIIFYEAAVYLYENGFFWGLVFWLIVLAPVIGLLDGGKDSWRLLFSKHER